MSESFARGARPAQRPALLAALAAWALSWSTRGVVLDPHGIEQVLAPSGGNLLGTRLGEWVGWAPHVAATAVNSAAAAVATGLGVTLFAALGLAPRRAALAALVAHCTSGLLIATGQPDLFGICALAAALTAHAALPGRLATRSGRCAALLGLALAASAGGLFAALLATAWVVLATRPGSDRGIVPLPPWAVAGGLLLTTLALPADHRGLVATGWLRNMFPASWLCIALMFRRRPDQRTAIALTLAGAGLATVSSDHADPELLILAWPAAFLAARCFSLMAFSLTALLACGALAAQGRLAILDNLGEARLLGQALQRKLPDDAALILVADDAEQALLTLAASWRDEPDLELLALDDLLEALSAITQEPTWQGNLTALLNASLSAKAAGGRRIFVSAAAEDRLRDQALHVRHPYARRMAEILLFDRRLRWIAAGPLRLRELRP